MRGVLMLLIVFSSCVLFSQEAFPAKRTGDVKLSNATDRRIDSLLITNWMKFKGKLIDKDGNVGGTNSEIAFNSDGTIKIQAKSNSGGSGSAYTEYGISLSGSSITIRIVGSVGVTAVKNNSSTITFSIPASGWISTAQIYYPQSENPVTNLTLNFNYASNTTFNQGLSTVKIPSINAINSTSTNARIYSARAVPSATDLAVDITSVSSGNVSYLIQNPGSLQSSSIVYKIAF